MISNGITGCVSEVVNKPAIWSGGHVANMQQDTLSITAELLQMQARSVAAQVPRLLPPKQACCEAA
jgi:hypothetical protein